jgi:hypothetical protein
MSNIGSIQFGTNGGSSNLTYTISTASPDSNLSISAQENITLDASAGSINLQNSTGTYGSFSGNSTGMALNASESITLTSNNSDITLDASGSISLTSNGTVNLINDTTQYGIFTSGNVANISADPNLTDTDLVIQAGNAYSNIILDASNIILSSSNNSINFQNSAGTYVSFYTASPGDVTINPINPSGGGNSGDVYINSGIIVGSNGIGGSPSSATGSISAGSINLYDSSMQYVSFSGDSTGNFTITSGTGEDVTSGVAGNLTLDASGDIILNNAGTAGSINLQNSTGTYGSFSSDSNGDLTIQSGSGSTENINLNAGQHINIGLYTTTSTTTYCYLAQDTNPINGLNGVSINSYDSINGNLTTNSYVTINAGSTGGNINLNGNGTVNLLNGTTQYGSFTGDTSGNFTITSGTGEDVTSGVAGNLTLDASGDIILNSLANSINLQNDGTTFGTFSGDATGNLTISSGSSAGNITLDASNIILNTNSITSDENIFFVADANSVVTTKFSIGNVPSANLSLYCLENYSPPYTDPSNNVTLIMDCPNFLALKCNNSIFLNPGNSEIYLQNGGTTFGKFTGDVTGNLSINTLNNDTTITLTAQGSFSLGLGTTSGTNNIDIGQNNGIYIDAANENLSLNANNLYLNSGDTYSISLQNGGITFGSFTGDASGNFNLTAGDVSGNLNLTGLGNVTINADGFDNTIGNITLNSAGNIQFQHDATTFGSFYIDASGDLNISPSGGGNLNLELGTSGWYVSLGDISNNTIPNNIPSNAKLSLNYTSSTMYISAPNDLVMESLGSVTLVSGATPTFDFNNTNGTFLSINQDTNFNLYINTYSAPIPSTITPNPNPTPNLSITALGSMYLISDGNSIEFRNNASTTFGTFSTPGSNNLSIASTGGTVYIDNNLNVGSSGGTYYTISAGSIDLYGGTTQYGSFSTTGSNNLTIDAGTGGTVTTSYVAPFNPTGNGIINQQALASIITQTIPPSGPTIYSFISPTSGANIPYSDFIMINNTYTDNALIAPPNAYGIYFLSLCDMGWTQQTLYLVVVSSQQIPSFSSLIQGGCSAGNNPFSPLSTLIYIYVPNGGANGCALSWVPLLYNI